MFTKSFVGRPLRQIVTDLSFSSIGWKTKHIKKHCKPGGHYAKLNKAVTEGSILHDFTYMRFVKWSTSQKYRVK